MHDLLFEHQRRLDQAHLAQYARQLGLDMESFERDMTEHTTYPRIQADLESGERSGVDQTPSFFIDGERYEGDWESDELLETLERRAR
jgi:protein-disulfide isomerase